MQVKTTMRHYHDFHRMTKMKKTQSAVGEDEEQLDHILWKTLQFPIK